MKSYELMIGDLISVYGRNNNAFSEPHWYIRKVTVDWLAHMERREANDKKLTDKGIVIPNQLFIGDTKPIHLTEEMLEVNGWVFRPNDGEYCSPIDISYKEPIRLQIGEDGNAFWWIVGTIIIIPINYVHELQQALRTCGLRELADNFKIE